jgi:hypothetical protein
LRADPEVGAREGEEIYVQRFSNPFLGRKQEILGSASWLACHFGGTGVPNASGWCICKCPVHNDQHASLSLKDTPRGLVVKCFAGCKPTEIKDAIIALRTAGAFSLIRPPGQRAESLNIDLLQTAARIWHASQLIAGTLAERYLRNRRITILPDTLRFHPALYHKESNTCAPAMVAVVQNAAGEKVGVHRTWLTEDGSGKASLLPVRKTLGSTSGNAVHLGRPSKVETLIVGEGVESVLSAIELNFLCGWAALSAPGLKDILLPAPVRYVLIAADHDAAGLQAAYRLRVRLKAEGRQVDIICPPTRGTDFNDLLRGAA